MASAHPYRRRKSAKERREQYLRAQGRATQALFRSLQAVHDHRNGELSHLGLAVFSALSFTSRPTNEFQKDADDEPSASMSTMRVDAPVFTPFPTTRANVDGVSDVMFAESQTQDGLRSRLCGQWETLPDSSWDTINKRFYYCDVSAALKKYCLFAAKFMSMYETIQGTVEHCSETSWGNDLLGLLGEVKHKFGSIRDIDHSRDSLLHNHEDILEVQELVMKCASRCEELSLLIDCYPKMPLKRKRYKFVRPADLTCCHYSPIELADLVHQMEGSRKQFWLSRLHEKYMLNHTWLSLREVSAIDLLYLVQQLRPLDRLEIDNGVFETMNADCLLDA
eukprot:TRINITY_DN71308_c0_g1_i1.p1 TRINITY_DN71308_c0_g1~~TRINITY_DN71308_c0_g1_i1.p1  ORF type:complete len:336 (+),score=24.63 TRINITY_DN71308_c0_g1_i1:67-1074(+)